MLSAVAARRAALAQTVPLPDDTLPSSPADHLASSSAKPPSKTGRTKRKPSAPAAHASPAKKSKTKKAKAQSERQPRQPIRPVTPEDAIFVDLEDDDEVGSDAEGSDTMPEPLRVPLSVPNPHSRRAWSPSRPLADSSDEEDANVLNRTSAGHDASTKQSQPISAYNPTPGKNLFSLSPEELFEYGGTSLLNMDAKATALVLRPQESFSLLGTCFITVLRGMVTISGAPLHASSTSHRVFSPRSSALPLIVCRSSAPSSGHTVNLPTSIHTQVGPHDAVLLVHEMRGTGVEGLGSICGTFGGTFGLSKWERNHVVNELGLTGVHLVTKEARDVNLFVLSPTWESALEASLPPESDLSDVALPPKTCLVKGPKRVGKSTFARTLLNTLLTRYRRVAFLECDIGQSEFTPAGMVALNIIDSPVYGPSFTHPSIPYLAHYVGSTTPRNTPAHYLASVSAILQAYRLDVQYATDLGDLGASPPDAQEGDSRITDVIPLVVNTMGWTKGLGADLNEQIEAILAPTDVFEFEAPALPDAPWAPQTYLDDGLLGHSDMRPESGPDDAAPRMHSLTPIPSSPQSAHYSAADHRALNVLSYLHAVFPSSPSAQHPQAGRNVLATSWRTTQPLLAQAPYAVSWARGFDRLVLTAPGAEDVVPDEIARVMNVALVGLVRTDGPAGDADPVAIDGAGGRHHAMWKYTQGASVPDPAESSCIGLALVRAVAPVTETSSTSGEWTGAEPIAHILTPLPPVLLHSARVVVKGELELPVWGMLDWRRTDGRPQVLPAQGDAGGGSVPYLRWGGTEEGVLGGEKRRVRRNLMRRGQM